MTERYIFIACPWTPLGGGMFKVADYLIQSQARPTPSDAASLRPLDTRGEGSAASSGLVLLGALIKILRGRMSGQLVGVHVNMAERLSLVRKCLVVLWTRLLGLPVVLHLHAAQLHHFYRKLPRLAQALVRWTFRRATTVVVLGKAAQSFVVDELHVPQEAVRILINGVPDPVTPRRRRAGEAPRRTAFFLGNLSERKGVSDLLMALAQSQLVKQGKADAVFAGGGDIAAYETKVRELGLDGKVRFVGWADQKAAAEHMARADALVLPSYDEGLPLVILEAMGQAVAVICTPVGEIGNTFVDGRDAVFVEPGNVPQLAKALDRVLGDDALRTSLERHGRHMFEQQFSLPMFFEHLGHIHRDAFGWAAVYGPASPKASPMEAQA